MSLQRNARRRLEDVRTEVVKLRESLHILDEQVAYVASVAEDTEVRAIVASTPLADRERSQAVEDLRRVRRQRDETAQRLEALVAEQDRLLDRLLEAGT